MSDKVFVGIDTSNYTTSCAICDIDGNLINNFKILLPVKEGERGLRQSDAVFAHIKNLSLISEQIKEFYKKSDILGIGYSAYPRDVDGSYMPCFLVGEAIAKMLSAFFVCDTYKFSHQAGHIMSAVYSSEMKIDGDFLAFHVSGGTTEIVNAYPTEKSFDIKLLGGSVDLHAGQAIDRIGVMLGLDFPCGKEIEKLALENSQKIPYSKTCVKKYSCNISGLENIATELYKKTNDKLIVSAFVLDFIGKTIEELTFSLRDEFPDKKIVYAGGVMSNSIIRKRLQDKFDNIYFAKPEFSTDNAAGIALLTRKNYLINH